MRGDFEPTTLAHAGEMDRTFDAPWQAQAFAMVVELNKAGYFSWDEWVTVFSREIARSPAQVGECANDTYYRQWLDALEKIVVERDMLRPGDTPVRAAEWRAAYINTPHGQAVSLANATCSPAHVHERHQPGVPIAVSSASAVAS